MRLHIYRCLPNMRTLLVFFQVLLSEGVMKEEATSSTCRIITTLTPSEYGCDNIYLEHPSTSVVLLPRVECFFTL